MKITINHNYKLLKIACKLYSNFKISTLKEI